MGQEYTPFSQHTIHYEDEDRQEQEIIIKFDFGSDRDFKVDDETLLILRTGRAQFSLFGELHTIKSSGADEVQLIYRLMKICGSELLRVAEDAGLEIYQYEPGDSKEPFDFFK